MGITRQEARAACRLAGLTADELGEILACVDSLTEDCLQQSGVEADDQPGVIVAWVRGRTGRQQPAIPPPPAPAPGDRWLQQISLALLRFLNPYGRETATDAVQSDDALVAPSANTHTTVRRRLNRT